MLDKLFFINNYIITIDKISQLQILNFLFSRTEHKFFIIFQTILNSYIKNHKRDIIVIKISIEAEEILFELDLDHGLIHNKNKYLRKINIKHLIVFIYKIY